MVGMRSSEAIRSAGGWPAWRPHAGSPRVNSVGGLLLLSYPLHRPGRPDTWRERTAHWPALTCPVLLLSGEADPFAQLPLLREAVGQLSNARLVTYPRLGHGLLPVIDQAVSAAAEFIDSLRR